MSGMGGTEEYRLGGLVIDFHAHLPWYARDPRRAAELLLAEMNRAGVDYALAIAIEVSAERFRRHVTRKALVEALMESMPWLISGVPGPLLSLFEDPESVIEEHERLIREHRRSSVDVAVASRYSDGRILAVASYNPDLGVEDNIEAIKGLRDWVVGVKLYPTLHFMRPDSEPMKRLYEFLERSGFILVVHTGCDPGLWELISFCEYGRPERLSGIAREFRDLPIVMAHLGGYSALSPGLYFSEALEVYTRYDNVYTDTSAVDPSLVELFVANAGYDRVLFGSDYPYVVGLTMQKAIEYMRSSGLHGRVLEAILGGNAYRLLRSLGLTLPIPA